MPIQFRCTYCFKRQQVPLSSGGKKVKCLMCGTPVEVPIVKTEKVESSERFGESLSSHKSQFQSPPPTPPPPPPPPKSETPSGLEELAGIKNLSNQRREPPRSNEWTPMRVVATTCGIALVALYTLILLAIAARLLSGKTVGFERGETLAALFLVPPICVACVVFYLLPSLVAYIRQHQNAVPILVINLVFGWTLVGWVGSLAWAFSSDVRESRQYIRQVIVKEPPDTEP